VAVVETVGVGDSVSVGVVLSEGVMGEAVALGVGEREGFTACHVPHVEVPEDTRLPVTVEYVPFMPVTATRSPLATPPATLVQSALLESTPIHVCAVALTDTARPVALVLPNTTPLAEPNRQPAPHTVHALGQLALAR